MTPDEGQLTEAFERACLRGDQWAADYLDAALMRLTLADDLTDTSLAARIRRANIATGRAMVTGCLWAEAIERVLWRRVSR